MLIEEDLTTYSRNSNYYNFWENVTSYLNGERTFISDDGIVFDVSVYSYSSNNNLYISIGNLRDYLATINNLDTPVTKTASQSMKITYTLTEAE